MFDSLSELQSKIGHVEKALASRFPDRSASVQVFDLKGVQVGLLNFKCDVPPDDHRLIFFSFKNGKLETGRSAQRQVEGEEVLQQILGALPTLVQMLLNQSNAHAGAINSGNLALSLIYQR